MHRFPPVEGTLIGTCCVPRIWPTSQTHIIGQIPIGDVEIITKYMVSSCVEVILTHRNGASATVVTGPLRFDNKGDPNRINWVIVIAWKGSDISVAAGGHLLVANNIQLNNRGDKVIELLSDAEILEIENNQTDNRKIVRGFGYIGPVPIEFESAKQEVERAARYKNILQNSGRFNDISDAWKSFLDAFGKAENKIIAAAELIIKDKVEAKSWYGLFLARRRASKLLTYVHHARNSDNHNIAAILSQKEGSFAISSIGSTWIRNIDIINGEMIIDFSGDPPSIVVNPSQIIARTVVDSGVSYPPPDKEIGLYQLSQGAITFLEEWLESAAQKFGK